MQKTGFDPWAGKILWRREWQPTPVFLPGEFNGQRRLAGHNPWGCKESGTTERHSHTNTHTQVVVGWYILVDQAVGICDDSFKEPSIGTHFS